MHSLALGVRHAGIIARNTTTPWSPSGLFQGSRRHIGTENVTTILSTVLLSFSIRTYTVVGSDSFLGVLAHLNGLSYRFSATHDWCIQVNLAWRYRSVVFRWFHAFLFGGVFSKMVNGLALAFLPCRPVASLSNMVGSVGV
jgi:hypothetical protein